MYAESFLIHTMKKLKKGFKRLYNLNKITKKMIRVIRGLYFLSVKSL